MLTTQGAALGHQQSSQFGATQYPDVAAIPMAPSERMGLAIQQAEQMMQRLTCLTDELCGGIPTEVASGQQALRGGGLFGALGSAADQLMASTQRAEQCLNRIQSALPTPPAPKNHNF